MPKPQNYVRRRIAFVASKARDRIFDHAAESDELGEDGFPIEQEGEWQMQLYASFFLANAFFKNFLYNPVLDSLGAGQ